MRCAIFLILALGLASGCVHPQRDWQVTAKQPDYERWARVRPGLSELEVTRLLGKPLQRGRPEEGTVYVARYGALTSHEPPCPVSYDFEVLFDSRSRTVRSKSDPFDGDLSHDGKPTAPRLILPISGSAYEHYPRVLDLRWSPSSGQYPMAYEVQLNSDPGSGWDAVSVHSVQTAVPHAVIVWVGKNKGAWRVRAKNRFGDGLWSEVRSFEFAK